jgi:tRNA (adenine57-N1/adenine58-N1)-methyltransferase
LPFSEGETVLLIDRGGNRRLLKLRAGAKAHGHKGFLEHDRMIGQPEGVLVRASSGSTYLVFRPRLSEFVLEMPRRSAIVYPKDVGFILGWADIYPGATVVESGLGSGSLTLALLRAVGPAGQVIVYEQRADMIASAMLNIQAFQSSLDATTGAVPDEAAALDGDGPANLLIHEADIYEGIDETDIDRLVLDLAEPWRVVPHALDALRPGGMIATYSPSILQVQHTTDVLEATRAFSQIETLEVLYRPWHLKGQSVRPVQQMVSHTAFLTFARRLAARGRKPGEVPVLDPAEHEADAVIDAFLEAGAVPDADPAG